MSVLEDPRYSYLVNKQPLFFQFWKKIFYYWCRFVFFWYTPVKISGRENLPSESAVFISNHNSHMDVALISAAAGKSFNYFGMLAAKDYWFDNTIKRLLTNFVMNLVPIARKTEDSDGDPFTFNDTIELCRAFMDQGGRNLVIFPEGSRGEPNVMRPFRKGAARFAFLPLVTYPCNTRQRTAAHDDIRARSRSTTEALPSVMTRAQRLLPLTE